jgi:hypothetical protein
MPGEQFSGYIITVLGTCAALLTCLWARYRFRSSTVKTGRVQCKFLCLYVVVNIANEHKKLQTPADIVPLYARKI